MILQVEKFQDSCKKILSAVDTDSALGDSQFKDTVELKAEGKVLHLNAVSKTYFTSINLPLEEESSLRAVVDAKLFLALISKLTTKTVELTTTDVALVVKANGTYKFPLKYDKENKPVELPTIVIDSVTSTFKVAGSALHSILNNNSKELSGLESSYYVDAEGCLTYTKSRACVNCFTIDTPTKVLLNQRLVKLFKLFKDGDVNVELGFTEVNGSAQTRVRFEQEDVVIISALGNQSAINTVPAVAIRGRANKVFDYSVTFDRKLFIEALDRLLLFDNSSSNKGVCILDFDANGVTIHDRKRINQEIILYTSVLSDLENCNYEMQLNVEALRDILNSYEPIVFNLSFGDHVAIVISIGNIKNILSEKREKE